MSDQKKMTGGRRIAILGTRGIPAVYGGFETFAQELSTRLAARGRDVTVYCESPDSERLSTYQGVNLIHIPAPRMGPLTTIVFDVRCLWHARKAYDVVYMLGYGAGLFCFIPRLWGSTVWINMDGIEWARSKWGPAARAWFKFMELASVRVPDRVIADAEGIREHLRSRHRTMRPCSVIPYGAPVMEKAPDPELLRPWGLVPDAYHLIVCRLEPENMIREVVQGFSQANSRYPLIIIGDNTSGTKYVNHLNTLQSDRIRFIGTVYDAAKLQSLRFHARSYIHGHRVGGTNPSLLEAMGCGNIVVAHDNTFNREVAGDAALYFRSAEDVSNIVQRVETLSAPEQQEMKTAAVDRVRKFYDWEEITDRYERLLRETVEKPR
jgi:glycosyltransferase involved in cell wall biosynthesis